MDCKLMPRLTAAERATLYLRGLYERFGYRKYKVSQFEEYGLYVRYANFLTGNRILSFTDLDGRLLALKPDVTLSIAKNARPANGGEKAYYLENVYRESLSSGTVREISQMGLEYIGGDGAYMQTEALHLARETLRAIGPEYVLEVSHMGFVGGLFEALGLNEETARAVLDGIGRKSPHGVADAARAAGVGTVGVNVLTELCGLSGEFTATLGRARALCLNGRMTQALDELERTVNALGSQEGIRLDFTLRGDMEYYDGLLLAGWIAGVPKPVLSGGRYDGLMKKMGRSEAAIGFALYLDELERLEDDEAADGAVQLAAENADVAALFARVLALTGEGKCVRVVSKDARGEEETPC